MTRNTSWLIICAALSCVVGAVATAANLPPPPVEPELARVYSMARDLQRSASGSGYFSPPSAAVSWPCVVDDGLLRGWAGALGSNEMEPRLRRAFTLQNRNQGRGSKEQQVTVRDVQIRPVAAQCQDGRLSGPVEYLALWLLELRDAQMVVTSHMAGRVRVTVLDDDLAPRSLMHVATRTTGLSVEWLDPATKALMKNARPDPSVTVTVSVGSSDPAVPSVILTETTGSPGGGGAFAQFVLPKGDERSEMRQFQDGKLTAVGHLKAGQLHGRFETFEKKVNGIRIAPSTMCYDAGELVKTAQCDVD